MGAVASHAVIGRSSLLGSGPSGGGAFVGALDAYTLGLAGAWSVSRRLLTSYEGALIRIRRSNDNAEQNIGCTSVGELDAATVASFVGSNSAFVTTVYDQSGNARNFAQATAAKQPRIVSVGTLEVNAGKPAMQGISANNTSLSCSSFAARTWMASGHLLSNISYSGLISGIATNIVLIAGSSAASVFTPSMGGYAYFLNKVDETADLAPFCLNATKVMTITSNSATEAWLWGSERNIPGRTFAGYMQEIAIYSTVPTFRSNAEQALMDYFEL